MGSDAEVECFLCGDKTPVMELRAGPHGYSVCPDCSFSTNETPSEGRFI